MDTKNSIYGSEPTNALGDGNEIVVIGNKPKSSNNFWVNIANNLADKGIIDTVPTTSTTPNIDSKTPINNYCAPVYTSNNFDSMLSKATDSKIKINPDGSSSVSFSNKNTTVTKTTHKDGSSSILTQAGDSFSLLQNSDGSTSKYIKTNKNGVTSETRIDTKTEDGVKYETKVSTITANGITSTINTETANNPDGSKNVSVVEKTGKKTTTTVTDYNTDGSISSEVNNINMCGINVNTITDENGKKTYEFVDESGISHNIENPENKNNIIDAYENGNIIKIDESTNDIYSVDLKTNTAKKINNTVGEENKNEDILTDAVVTGEKVNDTQVTEDTGIYKAYNIYDESIYNDNLKGNVNNEIQNIEIPNWGINDWINERASWQKQLNTATGEPSWWYFKIFFKFNTDYGLLGSILNNPNNSINSAWAYLNTLNKYGGDNGTGQGLYYSSSQTANRLQALSKFVKTLSYISSKAPWFFKSIKGLDKANSVQFLKIGEERSIEIGCNNDAVDMRLMTLLDLYKYICYDETNCREILPENLRQFDMTVVLFQTPLKFYQTAIYSKTKGKFDAKKLNTPQNRMSFKIFTFQNCEIDVNTLGNHINGDVNNETPFNMGNNNIKINYKRVYTHNSNEWINLLFSTDGSFENTNSTHAARIKALQNAFRNANRSINTSSSQYKEVIDMTETLLCDALVGVNSPYALGNLYDNEESLAFINQRANANTF